MIALKKEHKLIKADLKRVDLFKDGEGVGVGCYVYGGKLRSGLNADKLRYSGSCPTKVNYIYFSPENGKLFCNNGSTVYVLNVNGGSFEELSEGNYGGFFATEYLSDGKNCVLYGCGTSVKEYSDGEVCAVELPYTVYSGAWHCGRLFFTQTEGQTVYWTGEGGCKDWENGLNNCGYIQLADRTKGKIIKIIPFGGKLVLVREYGFTVMHAYGNPENFKIVSESYVADGIVWQTVAECGERIYFLTYSGCYYFDGSSVKKEEKFPFTKINATVCACGLNGKYLISCYSNELERRAVLCYDCSLKISYFINVNASAMCVGKGVYAIGEDGLYSIAEREGAYREYTCAPVTFTKCGKTLLRCVDLTGDFSGCVTVTADSFQRVFAAKNCVRTNVAGTRFTVKLSGLLQDVTATAVGEA